MYTHYFSLTSFVRYISCLPLYHITNTTTVRFYAANFPMDDRRLSSLSL